MTKPFISKECVADKFVFTRLLGPVCNKSARFDSLRDLSETQRILLWKVMFCRYIQKMCSCHKWIVPLLSYSSDSWKLAKQIEQWKVKSFLTRLTIRRITSGPHETGMHTLNNAVVHNTTQHNTRYRQPVGFAKNPS